MSVLYPLKFHPIFKKKIWGGDKIETVLNLNTGSMSNCGEAWMLSAVPGFESHVSEGPLQGNSLPELMEIYMDELLGEHIYEKYRHDFPLLIKFIDARQWLSIQVHPDDKLAEARGLGRGKTEMWYILDAMPGAELISGFRTDMSKQRYVELLKNKRLQAVLNYESVAAGDVFYIPAGRVHAIGPGILLAEIQQSSDTTYRIYDWDRVDSRGQERTLHIDEALDAIDFKRYPHYKTDYQLITNQTTPVLDEAYFKTNLIHLHRPLGRNYEPVNSFVIYICTEGSARLKYPDGELLLRKGEVLLIPAHIPRVDIFPEPSIHLIEVFPK